MVTKVTLIMDCNVRLKDLTSSLRDKLLMEGFEVVPDGHGNPSIKFDLEPKPVLENQSLIKVISFLANNGVAFSRDYTQMYSPAYTIELLRNNNFYKGNIILCGYNGEEWVYETK